MKPGVGVVCEGGSRKAISRFVSLVGGAAAIAMALTGCVPPAVPGWEPPTAAAPAMAVAASAPSSAEAVPTFDPSVVGAVGRRVRNDAIALAARFVHLSGVPEFNQRINDLLWAGIAATGAEYEPQAHALGSGLADRGCVAGSATADAHTLMTAPETGPVGAAGTSITCDITGGAGDLLAITVRVVTSDGESVTGDVRHRWIVDVVTGSVSDRNGLWSEGAASELWLGVVDLLRRDAGSLTSASLALPDDMQIALATEALSAAEPLPGGALSVTLPPGIAAPELQGLHVGPTVEPLTVRGDAATARSWGSELYARLLDAQEQPFVGLPGGASGYDCSLVPCVALTYDLSDQPSGEEPGPQSTTNG